MEILSEADIRTIEQRCVRIKANKPAGGHLYCDFCMCLITGLTSPPRHKLDCPIWKLRYLRVAAGKAIAALMPDERTV